MDRLIEEGEAEPQEARRQEIYSELERQLNDDVPTIFLYVPQEIEAATSDVRDWAPSPDGRINLHDVWLDARPNRPADEADSASPTKNGRP